MYPADYFLCVLREDQRLVQTDQRSLHRHLRRAIYSLSHSDAHDVSLFPLSAAARSSQDDRVLTRRHPESDNSEVNESRVGLYIWIAFFVDMIFIVPGIESYLKQSTPSSDANAWTFGQVSKPVPDSAHS